MRGRPGVVPALSLAAAPGAPFAGCSLGGGDEDEPAESATSPAPAQGEPIDLDVLVYNVEYGGGPETDAVIRQLDADVVGVLESYERLPEIARKTGYPYYNSSLQLLSKFPILEPSGGDGLYAMLEVEPGYAVPFFNVHLDYVAWGPRMLKNGRPVDEVIASENEVRTSAMEQPFAAMEDLLADGYPIFLTGDFNQPSSLDYTEATAGSRPEIPEPVAWPVARRSSTSDFATVTGRLIPIPSRIRASRIAPASASTTSMRPVHRRRSIRSSSASGVPRTLRSWATHHGSPTTSPFSPPSR